MGSAIRYEYKRSRGWRTILCIIVGNRGNARNHFIGLYIPIAAFCTLSKKNPGTSHILFPASSSLTNPRVLPLSKTRSRSLLLSDLTGPWSAERTCLTISMPCLAGFFMRFCSRQIKNTHTQFPCAWTRVPVHSMRNDRLISVLSPPHRCRVRANLERSHIVLGLVQKTAYPARRLAGGRKEGWKSRALEPKALSSLNLFNVVFWKSACEKKKPILIKKTDEIILPSFSLITNPKIPPLPFRRQPFFPKNLFPLTFIPNLNDIQRERSS